MTPALELQQPKSTLWFWQAYDPQIKSDLFSTAVLTDDGLTLVDPIPLGSFPLADLTAQIKVARVLVTNSNHLRAARDFGVNFGVPIFLREPGMAEMTGANFIVIDGASAIATDITPIPINGAAPGETAFHFMHEGGTIVIGDTLLHIEPYGFALLPAKYCSDQKAMRRSLRQLLDWPFERLLFAHGDPILSGARGRLEALLKLN